MKVEVAVLGSPVPNSPYYGLCGRKAALEEVKISELRSCVQKSRWPSWAPQYLIVLTMVSVGVKRH